MAARMRRSEPSLDTGLMPMEELCGKRICVTFISFWRNSMTFFASGVPCSHSIPA